MSGQDAAAYLPAGPAPAEFRRGWRVLLAAMIGNGLGIAVVVGRVAYGTLYLLFGLGAGLGPVLFGWAYDVQGHYSTILVASIAMLVVPALMLLTLGRYAFPDVHSGRGR